MATQTADSRVTESRTAVQRASDRELVVTRLFEAPPRIVFKAWAEAELFRRWWIPKGAGIELLSCQMDVRTGGAYRLEFAAGDSTLAFHGRYLEVVPNARIVWTNEEEQQGAVTTVTFQDEGGKTLLTFHEAYPSKEALEEAMAGSAEALPTQLDQLGEVLPQISD